jgi:hypothetical protein
MKLRDLLAAVDPQPEETATTLMIIEPPPASSCMIFADSDCVRPEDQRPKAPHKQNPLPPFTGGPATIVMIIQPPAGPARDDIFGDWKPDDETPAKKRRARYVEPLLAYIESMPKAWRTGARRQSGEEILEGYRIHRAST